MIILYEHTETSFTSNGLGCLNDALTCNVKEELNGNYELEMEYPVNGIHYSDIALRRIVLTKPNSYDQAQPFRIYSISKPINGIVTINAEHISYDLSGYPVKGAVEHYAWYVNDVFNHIRNNSVYSFPFEFSSNITEEKKEINLSKPRSARSYLGTEEGLLSLFGGEWEFDRFKAILHKQRGTNRGVSIEYGKNLIDVTQDEKCSEMYTAVYPFYYKEDDGLQYLDENVVPIITSSYIKTLTLDLTSEFEEMPTQEVLREKTKEYIKKNKLDEPEVSLKVSFVKNPEVIESLQDVRLGDTVGVKFVKIGVNSLARCISYEFNSITEQYNSIELGEPTKTIVDTMTSTNQKLSEEEQRAKEAEEKLKTLVNVNSGAIELEVQRATAAEGTLSGRIDITESNIDLEVQRAMGVEGSLSSSISLNADAITAEVQRAMGVEGSLSSSISLNADAITAEVQRAIAAEGTLSSSINITSNAISSEVTRATGAETTMKSSIEQTAKDIESEVTARKNADTDMSTRISQSAHSVSISASGSGNTASINIALYDENGNLIDTTKTANITITGFVSFQDLANAGQTTINGANITTGEISCDRLNGGTIKGQKLEGCKAEFSDGAESIRMKYSNDYYMGLRAGYIFFHNKNPGNVYQSIVSDNMMRIGVNSNADCWGYGSGSLEPNTYIEINKYGRINLVGTNIMRNGSQIATTSQIPDMTNYAKTTDLPNMTYYATKNDINGFIKGINVSLTNKSGTSGYTSNYFLHVSEAGTKTSVNAAQIHVSDRRLKEFITEAQDISRFYMLLNPVHFKYKDDVEGVDGHWHYGFIAQDVKQAFVDTGIESYNEALVGHDVDNDVWLLDKDEFHAMHVQMIQKQQKEIELLKQENFALQNILSILELKMEVLENAYNNKNN